uniref:Ig-like domain-containing protein n=1 Tax=Poecilia formosa TaxID=48698 RepID=A0A087YIS9_POEFO
MGFNVGPAQINLKALFSIPWVRGQNGWSVTYSSSQICTIKGSTVDLKCNYTHPDTVGDTVIEVRKLIWYTKGDNYAPVDLKDDQDYAGRIKYKHGCTVAIRDVRESDSAVYKFRFITNHQNGKYTGSPGVTLSVSAVELQVIKWERKQSGTRAEMTCKSKCLSDLHPYIWVKNGHVSLKVTECVNDSQLVFESIQSSDSGEYYCTSENMLNQVTSEGMFIDVKYPPSFPIVSHSFSGEVVEGDSVTLACSADANPAATYTWYKEHEANPLSKGPKLVFRSVQSSDSGKYFCTAENVLKRMTSGSILINVEYAPNLPRISLSASEIMEGISLTLSCSSDSNPAANYTWFKENEKTPQSSGQNLTITNIGRQHSGLYFCEAHNSRGSHKSAIHLTVAASKSAKALISVIYADGPFLFTFCVY